ncbi:MAG TPA: 16S rRNA (uracil(1498)-N(3))-methyltransferase [Elainellaceae cyanobacterium]
MANLQRVAIASSQIEGRIITLTPDQHHYLNRVLRLQSGDRFIALDGQGQWWLAQLTAQLDAQILDPIPISNELPLSVSLMVALPKTGMDDIVRQATELGVFHIQPILSDRTLLNPSPNKLERWRRIAKEAAEQAERQIVPHINEPVSSQTAWSIHPGNSRYICTARNESTLLLNAIELSSLSSPLNLATGPEGGWTQSEIEAAIAVGWQAVSLGRRILRATTAPIAALAIVSATLERIYPLNK